MPPIMEAQSLNHWIAREIPTLHFRMITLGGSSIRNTAREERLHKMVRWEIIRAAKELKELCHLFISLWLLWVFVAACGLSLASVSKGCSLPVWASRCGGFCCRAQALGFSNSMPRSQVRGLAPRPRKWSPEPRSPLELTGPHCNCCQKPPDLYQPAS